jgi:hypothetical protein
MHLRQGRRNTRWWRLYFRLEIRWALWEIVALRWQVRPIKPDQKERPRGSITPAAALAKLHETVRVAVAAIRSRLDLDLGKCANDYDQFRQRFPSLDLWWRALRSLAALTCRDIAEQFADPGARAPTPSPEDLSVVETAVTELFNSLSTLSGLPVSTDLAPTCARQQKHSHPLAIKANDNDLKLYTIIEPLLLVCNVDSHDAYYSLIDPG